MENRLPTVRLTSLGRIVGDLMLTHDLEGVRALVDDHRSLVQAQTLRAVLAWLDEFREFATTPESLALLGDVSGYVKVKIDEMRGVAPDA